MVPEKVTPLPRWSTGVCCFKFQIFQAIDSIGVVLIFRLSEIHFLDGFKVSSCQYLTCVHHTMF